MVPFPDDFSFDKVYLFDDQGNVLVDDQGNWLYAGERVTNHPRSRRISIWARRNRRRRYERRR